MSREAYVMDLGQVDYVEAWDFQRSLAAAVFQGAIPETVLFLEHPPTVTLGRRTVPAEVHVPEDAGVAVVETDRGGRSTYHGPGQLVCYPILDLKRHGKDVKRYCRDLEETIIRALEAFGIEATRIDGLTGVWLDAPSGAAGVSRVPEPGSAGREARTAAGAGPRKIASIGVHLSRWVSTHGYALNVDLDPAPFTEWITACGLEDAAFTSIARELGRPVTLDEVRPAARAAVAAVFDLVFEELPGDEPGLWPQPRHAELAR